MRDRPINLRDWQVVAAREGRLSVLVVPLDKFTGWKIRFDVSPPEIVEFPIAVGSRLWARETWCHSAPGGFDAKPGYDPETGANSVWYRATDSGQCDGPWRSSTQLPRWASRITIVPTEVRVCRLHDVTEDEARAAGALPPVNADGSVECGRRKSTFAQHWNDQYGPGAYERNPWCCVARVGVHLRNIDTMESERS